MQIATVNELSCQRILNISPSRKRRIHVAYNEHDTQTVWLYKASRLLSIMVWVAFWGYVIPTVVRESFHEG